MGLLYAMKKRSNMLYTFFFLIFLSTSTYALPSLGLGPFGPGVQDGTEPFNEEGSCANDAAKAAAGDDCGEKNAQVRSQDTVIFNWSVTANNYTAGQENPKNVMLEQILHLSEHAVVNFERIPARCTPAGGGGTNPASTLVIEANGDVKLSCNLGEFNEGAQASFSTVAKVSGLSWNGETFTSTQQVYSNADDGTANAVSFVSPEIDPIEISARPRLDISSSAFRGYYVYGKRDIGNGAGAESGFYTYYNLRVATHKKTGTESIPQPFSLTSELTAKKLTENGADYINSGMEYYMTQCIYNPSGWGEETWGREAYYTAKPIEEKVIESGTCAFARTDPNHKASPYTMTISGADLSGNRFPTKTIGGSDLSAGPYYYINMRVQFFIPTRVIDNADGAIDGKGDIFISNILKDFDPNSLSGTSNYGAAQEPGYNGNPMTDGSISNNIAPSYNYHITTKGSFSTSYYKTDTNTGWNYTYLEGQGWHTGAGAVGPSQAIVEKIFYQNSGSTDLTDPRSCLAFDNTTMKLTDRGNIGATAGKYAYIGEYTGNSLDYNDYIVEYGHVDFTGDNPLDKDGDGNTDYNNQTGRYEGKWDAQAAIRCDDNVATWHTDPTAITGGIDAVNVVRTRMINPATPFEPADYLRLNTPLEIRDTFNGGPHNGEAIPNGTVLASFGSVRSNEWLPTWYTRYYKPSPETGNTDGDRVTFTRVTTAIESESLLPVAAAGNTTSTVAGNQIVWKIKSAISSILAVPPTVPNVQIIDELPPEVSYNKNCTINYQDEQGTVIGTPADIVEYNTDRDGNTSAGYTRLTWNLGTWTANSIIPPRVICTDSDSLVANGTAVVNYSEIQGDGLTGASSERSDTHTITLEQIGSIQVSKKVDTTLDDVNDEQVYTLSWANFAASFAIDAPTLIDVFSFNGDDGTNSARSPKSAFKGNVKLIGSPSISWMDGATDGAPLGTWYYTTDAPASINYDPDNNTSTWVTEGALAGDFSQVTAIKFISNYQLEKDGDPHQGMTASYTLQMGDTNDPNSANANKPGDFYTNLFTLDTSSLPAEQFLRSNAVSVQVASYSVGDLIFADINGDLKYTDGIDIPAPDGITVELYKASDDSLVDATTTGIKGRGRYLFTDVGSGDHYVTIPASQFAPNAMLAGWDSLVTIAGADDDKNDDTSQDGYTTGTVIANGVRSHVFTLSAIPPLPGDIPKGDEPLGDNTGSLQDATSDDFSNYTLDIGLKPALDYGDAPNSYGDAGHGVPTTPTIYLGTLYPDTEAQTQNTHNGSQDGIGDDQTGKKDEDSLQLLPTLKPTDTRFQVNIATHNSSPKDAQLIGWIDFNNDEIFSANEASALTITPNTGGTKSLVWDNIPANTIQAGTLWMRLRFSTDEHLTIQTPSSALFDGEVEDYSLVVTNSVNISGHVFNDANINAGTKEANEKGINKVSIVLHDTINDQCISTKTNTNGFYQFNDIVAGQYTLYEAANEVISLPNNCPANAKDPTGYRSTTANTRSITVSTNHINQQDFGDVLLPQFSPDHTRAILADNVVFYPHQFVAKSTGSVTFTTDSTGAITSGWSSIIYKDTNCNGKLDTPEGSIPISDHLTTENTPVCLINKVYAPANVKAGEYYTNVITASFNFNNNAQAGTTTLTVTDLSKAAANEPMGHSRLELLKKVENITQGTPITTTQNQAKPGDILKYSIHYKNTGTGIITDLKINDAVPAFTMLHGVPTCQLPLPASLTSCTAQIKGDDIQWVFGINDVLKGGAEGVVDYQVTID